jgi:pilus assembly protein CpaB
MQSKMNNKKRTMIVAAVAGLLAVLLLALYVRDVNERALSARAQALENYGGEQTQVLVATRDILPGEQLGPDNSELRPWLTDLLPLGACAAVEPVWGRLSGQLILANEPLSIAKLSDPQAQLQIPDGLYAVSVPARTENAVGGAIQAGHQVHVYAVSPAKVELLLHRVLVLKTSNAPSVEGTATSAELGARGAELSWVTLAVRPEQVSLLLAAARDLELSLVLPGAQGLDAAQEQALAKGAMPGPIVDPEHS